MGKISKRLKILRIEGRYVCALYDIDYEAHKRPLAVTIHPLSKWGQLKWFEIVNNIKNGCFW